MSTQTAPNPSTGTTADDSHTVDTSHDQGGSPDETLDQAGGDDGDTTGDEGQEQQETTNEGAGNTDADDVAELRQQNQEMSQLIAEIGREMDRDPELAARLSGRKTGSNGNGNGNGQTTDWSPEAVETALRSSIKPEAADALWKALGPAMKRLQYLEGKVGRTETVTDRLNAVVGSSEFVNSLTRNGVTPQVMESKAFQRHLRSLRADESFRRTEATDKSFAGRVAANDWNAQSARRGLNREGQARTETARTGRGGNQPSRGASTAEKIVKITRGTSAAARESAVNQAHRLRLEAAKAGKPLPRIEYVDVDTK